MYFDINDQISEDDRIDIEEYTTGTIARLNKNELDNKSRKYIAAYLRSIIPSPEYLFKKGINISGDEKLEITICDEPINKIDRININGIEIKLENYKNFYNDIHLNYWKNYYEDNEYGLKEGFRYLSIEETNHVINLIYSESIIITLRVDLFTNEQ